MNLTPTVVTITSVDGKASTTVGGFVSADAPGLAITRAIYFIGGKAVEESRWKITHISSGFSITGRVALTRKQAKEALREFGALTDWTRDASAIRADFDARASWVVAAEAIQARYAQANGYAERAS